MMTDYVTLAEIDFDSGRRKYSCLGVQSRSGYYADKVESIGSITREVPLLPGEARISDGSLKLDDTDKEFRILRGKEPFRNRTVRYRFGDAEKGIDTFTTLFTGKIVNADLDTDGKYSISLRDASFDRFRVPIPGLLNTVDFPTMPPKQTPVVAPIIYGNVTSAGGSATGAVPCYLTTQSNPFRYLVAQHACKAVSNVYRYGVLLSPTAYTKTESVIGGKIYTFIDFTTDQRDTSKPNQIEITADIQGKTDSGTSTGNLITDPVAALKDFLLNHAGVLQAELNSTGFTAAATTSTAASYLIAGWISGDAKKTLMDVVNDFCKSFLISFFVSRDGLFSPSILIGTEFYTLPGGYANLTDDDDVIKNTFKVQSNRELASTLQYSYRKRWWEDKFELVANQSTVGESTNLGQVMTVTTEHPFIRDLNTAHKVAATRLMFQRENLQFAEFQVPINWYGLDLNQYVTITHFRGPSADGLGYKSEVFRIIKLALDFNPKSMKVTATAVKVPDSPEHADSHADQHADGHTDVAHSDVAAQNWHSDQAHTDYGWGVYHEDAYSNSHTDTAHGDSTTPHSDTWHGDTNVPPYNYPAPHSDSVHSDAAHSDQHSDQHGDVAHGDVAHADYHYDEYTAVPEYLAYYPDCYNGHGDQIYQPHGDIYQQYHDDSHTDTAAVNTHTDTHSDTPHYDTLHQDVAYAHTDGAHGDVAHQDTHSDYYYDNPHGDIAHIDAHGDSVHGDVPHNDQAHQDTIHDDFHADNTTLHGDVVSPHTDHNDLFVVH